MNSCSSRRNWIWLIASASTDHQADVPSLDDALDLVQASFSEHLRASIGSDGVGEAHLSLLLWGQPTVTVDEGMSGLLTLLSQLARLVEAIARILSHQTLAWHSP
jgi:hypothetical protein